MRVRVGRFQGLPFRCVSSGEARGVRMRRHQPMFLRVSREIESLKRRGHRVSTPWFNLLIERQTGRNSRVAIVVGRRFGIAVRRNRAKRVFRELVRATYQELQPEHNLLIFPKRDGLDATYEELKAAWRAVLKKQRLLVTQA